MSLFRNKQVLSWAIYDWANSAFVTTVMAGFFPIFFKSYSNEGISSEISTMRLGIANTAASLAIAVLAPFLGALADAMSGKKRFLAAFTILGVIACAMLSIVPRGAWFEAACLYGLGVAGFSGAIIFYDSLLPEVSKGFSIDMVSSLGFSLGYLGGGVLFSLNVLMYRNPALFGLDDATSAVKASFLLVAAWWFLFSLPLLKYVHENRNETQRAASAVKEACGRLRETLRKLVTMRQVLLFLCGYWLYMDGVNTVAKMAVDYGVTIGFEPAHLITALLLTQFIGFPSALAFGTIGEKVGARPAVIVGLVMYVGVTLWASQMTNVAEFYALAAALGLVQGGIQALSRSMYARLIPPEESGEFFGFFNLVGKFATIVGPLLVGGVTYLSSSHRIGISSVALLFFIGGIFLHLSRADQRSRV
jgi:MFS transporter, UMF1 family